MDFEVSMLINLGYEVFIPKVFGLELKSRSHKTTYEYDQTLSIDTDDLRILNFFDFYGSDYPAKVMNLLNKYFDIVFVMFAKEPMRLLTNYFNGAIYYRIFDLDSSLNYVKLLSEWDVNYKKDNVYFAESYPFSYVAEDSYLSKKSIYLPIGLSFDNYQKKEQELINFNNKQLLFVSPAIGVNGYYYDLYENFKRLFKDVSYTVVSDSYLGNEEVISDLENHELQNLIMTHDVLFYHSSEARDIPFYIFEAMLYKKPVLFIAGGLLSRLVPHIKLSGMCSTINEAKRKFKQICNGDDKLIEDILRSQDRVLYKVSPGFCEYVWTKNFNNPIPDCVSLPVLNNQAKKRKLGVILSNNYKGGVLTQAKNICRMLDKEIQVRNIELEIVLYFPKEDDKFYKNEFMTFNLPNVKCREYYWDIVDINVACSIVDLNSEVITLPDSCNGLYCYPQDNIGSLLELDYWLVVSDSIPQQLIPLKRYGIICCDYLQRYSSIMSDELQKIIINNTRHADCIFVTTPQTLEDVKQYLGIPEYKIQLLPMEFSSCETHNMATVQTKGDYFVWVTNAGVHKNHYVIAQALSYYYNVLGGTQKCHVTGVNSEIFDVDKKVKKEMKHFLNMSYVKQVRELIEENKLNRNLVFHGYVRESEYAKLIKGAKFILHGNRDGDDYFSLIESVYYGVPVVSTRYPATEFINERFGLNMLLCDSNNYKDIAMKLKEMEQSHLSYQDILPKATELNQFSWDNISAEYFDSLMGAILI